MKKKYNSLSWVCKGRPFVKKETGKDKKKISIKKDRKFIYEMFNPKIFDKNIFTNASSYDNFLLKLIL